jgi:hypothetical protein
MADTRKRDENLTRRSSPVPGWAWWGTLAGVVIVIAITVSGALLLAGGAADPPVAGQVIWTDDALAWAGGPAITLAPGESVWIAAPEAARLPPGGFTLSVSARWSADSDPGAAWGVWIATGTGDRVIYVISGEGYTTTRVCDGSAISAGGREGNAAETTIEDCPALRPAWRWMPYPRIQPPGAANTITLHREESGEVRLRLNHEILGAARIDRSGEWGVWLRGGRADSARLDWESAEVRGTS